MGHDTNLCREAILSGSVNNYMSLLNTNSLWFGECTNISIFCTYNRWRTQELFSGGGVQQIQLRTEDGENGDLGAVAPYSGVLEAAVIWYNKFHFI